MRRMLLVIPATPALLMLYGFPAAVILGVGSLLLALGLAILVPAALSDSGSEWRKLLRSESGEVRGRDEGGQIYDPTVHLVRRALSCCECGRPSKGHAPEWRAYLTSDDPQEVAVYCPECAEREFGASK
jgi:hypothetical protein